MSPLVDAIIALAPTNGVVVMVVGTVETDVFAAGRLNVVRVHGNLLTKYFGGVKLLSFLSDIGRLARITEYNISDLI